MTAAFAIASDTSVGMRAKASTGAHTHQRTELTSGYTGRATWEDSAHGRVRTGPTR